mgnify:CR=1 FL=1
MWKDQTRKNYNLSDQDEVLQMSQLSVHRNHNSNQIETTLFMHMGWAVKFDSISMLLSSML